MTSHGGRSEDGCSCAVEVDIHSQLVSPAEGIYERDIYDTL